MGIAPAARRFPQPAEARLSRAIAALNIICIVVAGAVRATLPGPDFTLAWQHSVEKIRWEESYRISGDLLTLFEARIEGNGAGMESPPGARLQDGQWVWQPQSTHAELRLTRSTFTRDYTLCSAGHCADLGEWVGETAEGEVVSLRSCPRESVNSSGREKVGR